MSIRTNLKDPGSSCRMGLGSFAVGLLALASGVAAQEFTFAPGIPWLQTESQPGVHDPTVIRDDRGVYTLMSTNNLLAISQSTDLANWSPKGKLLNAVPAWMLSAYPGIENIWAPQLSWMGGRWWVYYCGSVFGKNTSLIGAMWSPTLDVSSPDYKWTDIGEVWRSTTANDYNAIDPEILVDPTGRAWMSFGSFWQGLRMIAIDPATGKQSASDKTVYTIASRNGGAIEGPSTIQHGAWTYLFAPFDKCCDGAKSTYRTMYGRSAKPTGPYLDESGKDMANGGGTQLVAGYGRYAGPGGGSPFHDGRCDYFALHYYDKNRNGASFLQLREILYGDDGWLELGQPFLGRHWALEAEHAVLVGDSILTATGTAASNREYVGFINGANSSVEFLANTFQEGRYLVGVRYAAGDGDASHRLVVNDLARSDVAYPKTAAWGTFPPEQVVVLELDLKKGRNSLKFSKGTGFAELDRIDIVRKADDLLRLGDFDRSAKARWVSGNDALALESGGRAVWENLGFSGGPWKAVVLCASAGTGVDRLGLGAGLEQDLDVSVGCNLQELSTTLQGATGIRDMTLSNAGSEVVLESAVFLTSTSDVARKTSTKGSHRAGIDALGRSGKTGSVLDTRPAFLQ
ncbi:MAG TPA: family 43 glycosylhydrolase [Fibrobacteria bacterium]|nr:family 43 glycosylhydrolase [Fibrobacteria bacterium]